MEVLQWENMPGGECSWSGCIRSKALINIANGIQVARKFSEMVVDTGEIFRKVINNVYQEESPEVLKKVVLIT